jgi:uncharacterized protein YfcZ (UPF0381/DUF406 family)
MNLDTRSIIESINQQMPQQVGELLKQRLKKADADAATVEEYKKQAINSNAEIERLGKVILELTAQKNALDSKAEDVKRERAQLAEAFQDVQDQKVQLKVDRLSFELAAERRITATFQETMLGLVRNTEFKTTALG